jgi:MFS family permease
VFLAYGVAGIAGPQIAGYFKDIAVDVNAWKTPFVIAGIACLVAAALAMVLKPVAAPAPVTGKGKKK